MKHFLLIELMLALVGSAWGVDPVTFNSQAFSTNDPIDSAAAEAAFLNAVAAGGFSTFSEDFENAVWDGTRSPYSMESVISHNIDWHSSAGDRVRTVGDSDSYQVPQPYVIYAVDSVSGTHPAPNTVSGESGVTLYGLGFWADGTGTKGKIKVILDDAVEVKFQRITGYTVVPPDPPEPIKETVRLTYEKEFYGVYAPDGFTRFQLLEFAGEFDEVVLMWMRTFTFAYVPPVPTTEIQITRMEYGTNTLQVEFASSPGYSNFILQANSTLLEPLEWTNITNAPTVISANEYRFTAALPPEPVKMFRILSIP